jgi:hypothetical protein
MTQLNTCAILLLSAVYITQLAISQPIDSEENSTIEKSNNATFNAALFRNVTKIAKSHGMTVSELITEECLDEIELDAVSFC